MTKPPSNPRLLMVVNSARVFLTHRLPIGRAAQAEGFQVHVAALADEESQRAIEQEGFVFHAIQLSRSGMNPWREWSSIRSLAKLYGTLKPDIVHHVTIKPVLYGSLVARWLNVPCVVNGISGLGYIFIAPGIKAALIRAAVKCVYRAALGHPNATVIFQNPDDLGAFVRDHLVRRERTALVRGSGVDLTRFKPSPQPGGAILVVLPARMLWDKGVAEFVAAAGRLVADGVKARYALVGDSDPGNPAAVPPEQLNQWRREGIVEWWGHRDDMPEVFAQAHIVCLPSYREGLPKALIEAAACARPIITTDVPGCREIVHHNDNGLLVPARNAAALAAALKQLIEDGALRRRMGGRGRQRAEEEYSDQRIASEHLAVYRTLLMSKQTQRVNIG